jgi:hypothetical protein
MKGKLIECPKTEETEKSEFFKTSSNNIASEENFQNVNSFLTDNQTPFLPVPVPTQATAAAPAILAARGTLDTIKFSDRPKPVKKEKVENPVTHTKKRTPRDNKNEKKTRNSLNNADEFHNEASFIA